MSDEHNLIETKELSSFGPAFWVCMNMTVGGARVPLMSHQHKQSA
ncbi:hypothetical protein [Actibacterium lipolyticum]|uniref:Uncharacterized protein n=1 Tax=Actibacterium lipolyticum TaxID=1524263 RepID=A0A238JYA3_9RHOB|nr:hypothetical protein [Actibacterium lipolyticum]SMX34822.1 hypothetical protein COL8621_01506 [Actibacterium lipolyticum]